MRFFQVEDVSNHIYSYIFYLLQAISTAWDRIPGAESISSRSSRNWPVSYYLRIMDRSLFYGKNIYYLINICLSRCSQAPYPTEFLPFRNHP